MKDQTPTLIEVIENTLHSALLCAAHTEAYSKTFGKKVTPANELTRSAHYWAREREDKAADIHWALAAFARVES